MKTIRRTIIISFATLVAGCNQPLFPQPNDPAFAPTIPDVAIIPKQGNNGSLYVANHALNLYQDIKAYNVGDILTVKLVEKTTASKDAKTTLKRGYENELVDPATVLGNTAKFKARKLLGLIGLGSKNSRERLVNRIDADSEFSGEADSNQKNSLTGDITVTVAQVLPNKNLVVKGEKWLNLNQGSEFVRLTGIVRPNDISPANEVLSSKIADARISYSGTGALADTNRAGWLARFFNSIAWPF